MHDALNLLREQYKCASIMVEGGRAVIASFLANPQLVRNFVATLSPKFIGGLGPSDELAKHYSGNTGTLMSIRDMRSCAVGEDIVVYGAPASATHANGITGDSLHLSRNGGCVDEPYGLEEHELVRLESSCRMWIEAIEAECEMKVYSTNTPGREIVALSKGEVRDADSIPVRVHSECFTGDVLGSKRCDCGPQLHGFLQILQLEAAGVLLYIRGDEGRGIGLVNKIRAYELQEKGLDTVDANLSLGLATDSRTFESSRAVLEDLGVRSIKLYTNNPEKARALRCLAREICPLNSVPNEHNMSYLLTKRNRLNHATLLSEIANDKARPPLTLDA